MDKDIKEIEQKVEEIYKIALNNQKAHKKNAKDIKDNFARINQNSYALGILKDYKKAARRWFIAFVIMTILFAIVCIHHFFF